MSQHVVSVQSLSPLHYKLYLLNKPVNYTVRNYMVKNSTRKAYTVNYTVRIILMS